MNNVLDFEEEKTEVELLGKINNILTLLDDVDKAIEELPQKQSNIELLRSDLEHLLEDKEMGSVGYKNIAKELERVRKQRRHLKKAYEVIKCFQNNRNKITYKEQRPFVRNSIELCYKELQTSYNYRLLNAQNIKDLIGEENYSSKRKTSSIEINNEDELKLKNGKTVSRDDFEELLNSGLTNAEIGEMYGLTSSGISRLKLRFGIETRKKKTTAKKIDFNGEKYKPGDITLEMYNELKEKGYNQRQMADYWGFGASSITDVKRRLGLDIRHKS